jgi:hypothetical protein
MMKNDWLQYFLLIIVFILSFVFTSWLVCK